MVERREFLRIGLATTGVGALAMAKSVARGEDHDYGQLLQYLCPPDNLNDQLTYEASPYAEPFKTELFEMPVAEPVASLDPPPEPDAHQRYEDFPPKKFYEIHETEFYWPYHVDEPYSLNGGTPSWGFSNPALKESPKNVLGVRTDNYTPGPTVWAHYGEPVLMRMVNSLPPIGTSQAKFALPSTTTHLHNFHSASESDGNPQDWIDSGEFWDHHYASYPSAGDSREKLSTLWYHDHRLDFTAANVYAGLSAYWLMFDEHDTGIENDKSEKAWRLPGQVREGGVASGRLLANYDIPLLFHDVKFDAKPKKGPDGRKRLNAAFDGFVTSGWLGDQMTVNRTIRPFMNVEPRPYRFRFVNGGPSRFLQLELRKVTGKKQFTNEDTGQKEVVYQYARKPEIMTVITGDGNFLEEPVDTASIYYSVAQRTDIIVDFSKYEDGDQIALVNVLEQTDGEGPSGRLMDPPDGMMCFRVKGTEPKHAYHGYDGNGHIPNYFRPVPDVDMSLVKQERVFDFDYDGGLWTINGRVMDPNRSDAGVEQGSAEIWTFRNTGNSWSHPIHCHFTEFIVLEVNGVPVYPNRIQASARRYSAVLDNVLQDRDVLIAEHRHVFIPDEKGKVDFIPVFMGGPRRDVATLLPNDVIKVYFRFSDFLGKYVMHCHNVVHEDHAMMLRWDIVEPGHGYVGPKDFQSDTFFLQERAAEGTDVTTPVDK